MDKKAIQILANRIARREGYGLATEIRIDRRLKPGTGRVISHTRYGYRKYTTGEYVPNKYLANFGWKNTYYQHAETVVVLNPGKEV